MTSEATMPVLSEAEMAAWKRESGAKIICRRGRYWEGRHRGFYQGVHWLARMRAEEARLPTIKCYGYRTALHDDDARFANATIPVHLLSNVEGYGLGALPGKRRNKLRKCWKLATIVRLTDGALLREQGYAVRRSVTERLGIWRPPPEAEYAAAAEPYARDPRRLILAGLVGGRLGGYLEAQAVDGTAYVEHVYIATEALPSELGTGLVYELVQACRRSGKVREIVYGWDYRQNESLKFFKFRLGFPIVQVPSRLWMLPLLRSVVRWRAPNSYYWLTGRD